MMTEEEYKKYKEALLLFYGGGRYILNNRFLPGIPTLPDIQEYTITFTNLDYPDLPIDIPEPITDISGTVVTLPTISGEYEDVYNYYTPESWSIGSFGSEIELLDNLTANLIFNVVPKVVTYTVSFENTTYPEFDVSIPDSIIVPEGDSITLPSVSGEYEDEEYTYTPLKWSIGEFGEVIIPDSNLTADLVWNVEPIHTYNIIGGLISETESIDWLSLDVLGNMNVDNVNLYSDIYQFGTVCVDNIALTQDFYMLGKLMHDYDPAIEDASFVVYDTLEDSIVSYYKQELVYSEIEGIVLNSPEIIIGVPQTVPNRSFFFTENGREETNNTSLETGSTLPLYDEYGNLITDADTIALYDNSQALSFMKEEGNMEQALNSDLLVDNDGELSLQLSSQTRSSDVEQEETITIDSTFGAEVTIPEGYKVDSVLCSRGYVFASSVTNSGTVVDYELPGEKVYFDDTNTALVGVQVRPALKITVINSLAPNVVATLSSKYGDTGVGPETASASYVNSGGFLVKGTAKYSDSLKSSKVSNAMQQFPVYFNLSDSPGNWLYFCFNVPQTLWKFQNGVFSWLGDKTDATSLAYWYNTRPVKINLSLKQVSREITAWSVQTERVFVLQFSNSGHPSLDIPMPSNETGHLGTVITLPTVTGEYTEDGMVYTPVAWNIGAFGDSYTLNNDVTAILQLSSRVALPTVYSYSGTQTESSVAPDASIDTGLTYDSGNIYLGETNDGMGNATRYGWKAEEGPEPPAYTEITLYMQDGSKAVQRGVTSGYTEDVVSGFCYQLYIDEACTIPWKGYDYSNDYEIGYYADGAFVSYPRQTILDLPNTITYEESESKVAQILLDIGYLWLCSNYTLAYNQSVVLSQITLRIYPKDQSLNYYVGYFYSNNAYGNRSGNLAQWPIYTAPGTSTLMTYFGNTTIVGLYGSAGNPVALTADDALTYYQQDSTWLTFRFKPTPQRTMAIRAIVFTTPKPMEIDIDVNFGDAVTIPAGYHVESVKCEALFIKASRVYKQDSTNIAFEFLGENEYCDDTDLSLFGVKVSPCIQVFAFENGTYTGIYLSVRSSFSGSNIPTSSSAIALNSGGVFLSGRSNASFSIINSLNSWLNLRPAWISRTDNSNNRIPYYFRIQQSVWQFSGGAFSWLGNTTDETDPAYWYNGLAVRIHCVKI